MGLFEKKRNIGLSTRAASSPGSTGIGPADRSPPTRLQPQATRQLQAASRPAASRLPRLVHGRFGGNPMMTQQMLNPSMLSQQNQLSGIGSVGGRTGGMSGIDFSDPNTAALLQQILAQQSGGRGQSSAGLPNQQAHSQGATDPVAGAEGSSQASSDQVDKSVDV